MSQVNNHESQVRISINLPDQLNEELKRTIPWGVKNSIIICLLMKFIELIGRQGKSAYVHILSGEFDIVVKGGKPSDYSTK